MVQWSSGRTLALDAALYIRDCESLCLSDETVKAVGPFYLVSGVSTHSGAHFLTCCCDGCCQMPEYARNSNVQVSFMKLFALSNYRIKDKSLLNI